mmetsp:Transcript_6161/g.18618  ORF Transcript_6161/g.18618 Transcript_6161/m.18618 type:complete len:317 (+) Transcript_6161:48-998(+)
MRLVRSTLLRSSRDLFRRSAAFEEQRKLSRALLSSTAPVSMGLGTVGTGLLLSAGIFTASNIVNFGITAATRTHKTADLLSAGPFVVSALATYVYGPMTPAGLAITAITCLWGTRLTYFLVSRVFKTGKDQRFEDYIPDKSESLSASSLMKMTGLFSSMVAWGFVVSLPVTVINSSMVSVASPVFWLAMAGSGAGLMTEILADRQKSEFKADDKNKGDFIRSGLWHYSRHPNYFGEILFWWSNFAAVVAACGTSAPVLATAASPLMTTFLLLKVSGIPLAEKKYDERYSSKKEWKQYKQTTNLLVPWSPKPGAPKQ